MAERLPASPLQPNTPPSEPVPPTPVSYSDVFTFFEHYQDPKQPSRSFNLGDAYTGESELYGGIMARYIIQKAGDMRRYASQTGTGPARPRRSHRSVLIARHWFDQFSELAGQRLAAREAHQGPEFNRQRRAYLQHAEQLAGQIPEVRLTKELVDALAPINPDAKEVAEDALAALGSINYEQPSPLRELQLRAGDAALQATIQPDQSRSA